jgi:predicted DNA-binding protein with PD1-like motif
MVDEVASGLTEFAETRQIEAGHVTAIGAFSSAVLAYYDRDRKAYKTIVIDEQVEVLSPRVDRSFVDQEVIGESAPL